MQKTSKFLLGSDGIVVRLKKTFFWSINLPWLYLHCWKDQVQMPCKPVFSHCCYNDTTLKSGTVWQNSWTEAKAELLKRNKFKKWDSMKTKYYGISEKKYWICSKIYLFSSNYYISSVASFMQRLINLKQTNLKTEIEYSICSKINVFSFNYSLSDYYISSIASFISNLQKI